MTEKMSELLQLAADRTVSVVRGISDSQLGAPTPCSKYDVRGLVEHLFQVVVQFQALAAKKDAGFGAAPEPLAAGWRDGFAEETVRLVAAWDAPGAEEGVSGGMGFPARTIGAMALGDLTVHGWDLARATGQPYELEVSLVEAVGVEYGVLAPKAREMGMFGEPVPVRADASAFEVLLGVTGRDPYWTRP